MRVFPNKAIVLHPRRCMAGKVDQIDADADEGEMKGAS